MKRKINKKQTFLAGVLTIAIAQVVVKFFGLFYRLVITNIPYFGDEGNGIYGAGFQIYTLVLAIVTTGIPIAVSKLVSEKRALRKGKRILSNIQNCICIIFNYRNYRNCYFIFWSKLYSK